MVNQSAGAQDKAVELVGGVQFLDAVEQAGDDVVSAGSLTARKNDTNIHYGESGSLGRSFKLDERHAIRVGEQFLNSFLVGNRLGSLAGYSFHMSFQRLGQLGLVGSPCDLQCTFSHIVLLFKGEYTLPFKGGANFAFFP